MAIQPLIGTPGFQSGLTVNYGQILQQPEYMYLWAGGGRVSLLAADPFNATNSNNLRAGLLMGLVSSGYSNAYNGMWLPSVIDGLVSGGTQGSTTLTFTATGAAALVARVGGTGTFSLSGPPVANGTPRTVAFTYSAVNTTSGAVTVTSPTVNAVVTLGFTNSPAGTFQLTITDYNGVSQRTAPITYSSTPATLVSNIQTAINVVIPQVSSVNQIVVSGSAVTAILLTYSGVNYSGLTQANVGVDVGGLSAGNVSSQVTTAAVDARFVANSFLGGNDGSQVPLSVVPDGSGILMAPAGYTAGLQNVDWPFIYRGGVINAANLLPYWPSDTGLQSYIMNSMNSGPNNYGFTFAGVALKSAIQGP